MVQMEIANDFENNIHDRELLPGDQAHPRQDETAVTQLRHILYSGTTIPNEVAPLDD